jgi:hypothetical protein
MQEAAEKAKLKFEVPSDIFPTQRALDKTLTLITSVGTVFVAMDSLGSNKTDCEASLQNWTEWRLAEGETDTSIPLPFLEKICRGSTACSSLGEVAEDTLPNTLSQLVTILRQSILGKKLQGVLKDHLVHSLTLVVHQSFSKATQLQDEDTVTRYHKNGKLTGIPEVLLAGTCSGSQVCS